jgi:hypothetical protein
LEVRGRKACGVGGWRQGEDRRLEVEKVGKDGRLEDLKVSPPPVIQTEKLFEIKTIG